MTICNSAYKWLVLMLVNCWVGYLPAQDLILDTLYLEFEELGVSEGVSTGLVWSTVQDQQGYLWLGTKKGLNRYDGYKIKQIGHNRGDSLSMTSETEKIPRPSLVDSRNNIWLYGRFEEGRYVYDQSKETFTEIDVPINFTSFEDPQGSIWFYREDKGWNVLGFEHLPKSFATSRNIQFEPYFESLSQRFTGLNAALSMDIELKGDNELWGLTKDSLYAYHLDFDNASAALKIQQKLPDQFNSGDRFFHKLVIDKVSDRVYMLGEKGYCEVGKSNGVMLYYHRYPSRYANPKSDYTRKNHMLCDSKGRIWVLFYEGGFCRLDPQKGRLSDIRILGDDDANFEEKRGMTGLFEDKDHNLWIKTRVYGLYKYALANERFSYYGDRHRGPSIGELFTNKADQKIVSSGALVFDKAANNFKPLVDDDSLVDPDKFLYGAILAVDNENFIYRAKYSDTQGLCCRIDKDGNILEVFHTNGFWQYTPCEGYFLFREHDGVWRLKSTYKSSLRHYRLQKVKPDFQEIIEDYEFEVDIPVTSHPYGLQTNGELIWIAYSSSGLLMFNKRTKELKHFTYNPKNHNTISDNKVLSLLPDPVYPDSLLWIGTDSGLDLLNIQKDEFTHYGLKDGFPDNTIYGILADKRHNLWISTNRGLFVFDPREKSVLRTFAKEDGLQHDEFNTYSFAQTADGTMYFGGVGGLTYFDPEDFYGEYGPSPVVINRLRILNKKIEFSRDTSVQQDGFQLEAPIGSGTPLTFSYDQRMITFEFAVLDLTTPKENEFRYRLKGFSDDWIELGTRNEATLTNLDPGNYKLQVQGANHHGVWNEAGASIEFQILPPWWGTWWFRLFVISGIAYLLYYAYNYQLRQKDKMHALRNRISQDLHDEIGSTLSSIALFGTVARKSIKADDGIISKMLNRINDSTTQVMESMNDIVWTIKSDNDKMIHLINRMRAYTSELTDTLEWKISFTYDDDLLNLNLSMVHRRNIYLIVKEAVNNAVKYSGGDQVSIQLENRGKLLVIKVMDNGKGFDILKLDNQHSLGGNGLKNMKRRADELKGTFEIDTKKDKGTIIKLSCDTGIELQYH